jgi:hypothetical protein
MFWYVVAAIYVSAWIFVIYELITAPLIKEDERPIRNNRPSKHGLHEGQGR